MYLEGISGKEKTAKGLLKIYSKHRAHGMQKLGWGEKACNFMHMQAKNDDLKMVGKADDEELLLMDNMKIDFRFF
ncbi:hypothetical protein L1987_42194 [Smallanthus sonchifolius]|uniref:Uncharacterized protein n=1 Tax=Smallanthus sonchifolius TaxID=185202 RepID=A0ACB9GVS5_9ASTR|nr:hypothetical protein L1987_42194 [Smallanthus sonchifolius]